MRASSPNTRREWLRAVGPVAWVLLEELSLHARRDDEQLVATTSTAELADAIGIGRDAVSRGLRRLRDHDLLKMDAVRGNDGRFVAMRYSLLIAAPAVAATASNVARADVASTTVGASAGGNVESGADGDAAAPTRQRRRSTNASPTRQRERDSQLSIFNTDPA